MNIADIGSFAVVCEPFTGIRTVASNVLISIKTLTVSAPKTILLTASAGAKLRREEKSAAARHTSKSSSIPDKNKGPSAYQSSVNTHSRRKQ